MDRIYVALDLETTGLDPDRDQIIEIGMVRFRGDEVLETYSSLVRAERAIPLKTQQLTGISQDEVDQAQPVRAFHGRVLAFLQNYPVVGHSIEQDLAFLRKQGLSVNNLAIDTFELATILLPHAERYSLAHLSQVLGLDVSEHHRALADAVASKDLFLALVAQAQQWDPAIWEEVVRLAQGTQWPLTGVFRDLVTSARSTAPLGTTGTSAQHQSPAPRLRRLYGKPEGELPPLEPTPEPVPLDASALAALIEPGGPFEEKFAGYEYRPEQVEMLRGVADAFNTPAHLLVEAGTGIGKSVAYLIPALYYAVANGRRVVVSSNTINLQEQLYTKDLPDLQRILPITFSAALLKGRNNYLCLRRLHALRRVRQLDASQVRAIAKILAWLPQTTAGDRSELVLIDRDQDTWQLVQAESDTCMGDRCPYNQRRECFFYRARSRAERAHLVVVNHALLLSDLALESRMLPEYKHVIVDEAHHLEEQATDQFGFQIGQRDLSAYLSSLSHAEGLVSGGLLAEIPTLLREGAVAPEARLDVNLRLESLNGQVDRAQRRQHELFNTLDGFLGSQTPETGGGQNGASGPGYDQQMRLTSGTRAQPEWSDIEVACQNLTTVFEELLKELDALSSQLDKLEVGGSPEADETLQNLRASASHGAEICANIERILLEPDAQGIYWMSVSARRGEVTLCSAPLHVGNLLSERLFAEKDCVVLTSATLRSGKSFKFIRERLGLEEPNELAVDSPFDYQSAALLYVPKDIPEPNQPYYQKTVEKAIVDIVRATEGRALVLFTSNSQLNATYRAIQRPLEQEGIVVYGQGLDGSRRQILENFRGTPRSVLLGTRSFWEGVDVVGEALSCLIITRLPFAVPTDPILTARAETFEDPFNEFYLPESILRFRQGFGRLIRSKSDVGIVVVLDKRLITKAYGPTILRSLPPCLMRQGPLESLPERARAWLDPTTRR